MEPGYPSFPRFCARAGDRGRSRGLQAPEKSPQQTRAFRPGGISRGHSPILSALSAERARRYAGCPRSLAFGDRGRALTRRPAVLPKMAGPGGSSPPGPSSSAREPVSRILFAGTEVPVAVIPLGEALPLALSSDLPGGFGTSSSRLAASGRCAAGAWLLAPASLPIWSCSVWGLPCRRHYCRRGALLPHLFTLTGDSPVRAHALQARSLHPRLSPGHPIPNAYLAFGVGRHRTQAVLKSSTNLGAPSSRRFCFCR
jgi:hypothetical protein